MDCGDSMNSENVVIPNLDKFYEIDPYIKDFEVDLKRR